MNTAAPDRIAHRYPRHAARRRIIIAACGVVGFVGAAWLLWAATIGANPSVSGQVAGFTVVSDTEVRVDLVVERPDPARAASCTVVAQSLSYERVGEVTVQVAPGTETRRRETLTIRTFKRATSASLEGCRPT